MFFSVVVSALHKLNENEIKNDIFTKNETQEQFKRKINEFDNWVIARACLKKNRKWWLN